MNTFNVEIYNYSLNTYESVAFAETPLAYGNLLDERLDEANIVIISSVEKYEPMTRVCITITTNVGTASESNTIKYFSIANDNAKRLYPSSTKYEHQLYLVEVTKELEGFICQSITFTSRLNQPVPVSLTTGKIGEFNPTFDYTLDAFDLQTPMVYSDMSMPSIGDVAVNFNDTASEETGINYYTIPDYEDNLCKITVNGVSTSTTDFNEQLAMPHESFDIQYRFAIENFGGVAPTTYEFNYTFHIEIVETLNPQKPYTIKDCIDRVLKLAEPIRYGDTQRFTLDSTQAQDFNQILAPDFTMTKCTLREQLQVIGGYIHAEPRLVCNGLSDIVYFDSFGLGQEATISNDPFVDETIQWTSNEYNTAIETNASNMINTLDRDAGTIYDSNAFDVRSIRTDTYQLLGDTDSSFIKTVLPIKQIYKVVCLPYKNDGTLWDGISNEIDITKYVFEKHDYDRKSSFKGSYPNSKQYALCYEMGKPNITGLFYKAETELDIPWNRRATITYILKEATGKDFYNYIATYYPYMSFRVEYLPIYSAMFSHSKQYMALNNVGKKPPFYKPYAQGENMIESSYYGENIKGVAQRMGNPEKTATFVMYDLSKVPQVGQTFKGYAISGVNIEILPTMITCSLALTKDFNRISQYIGINSNKRIFEVSEQEAYARNILIREYYVICGGRYISQDSDTLLSSTEPIVREFYRGTINIPSIAGYDLVANPLGKPISAVVAYRNKMNDVNGDSLNKVILPVVSSAFGNVISLSWQYKDNYGAGEFVSAPTGNDTAYYQQDVPYADYYGRLYWYHMKLYAKLKSHGATQYGLSQAMTDALVDDTIDGQTPLINTSTKPYLCMKDNREILSFNYQLEFVSTLSNVNVHSALASENPLVRGVQITTGGNNHDLVCYVFNDPVGKFQQTIDPTNAIGGCNLAYGVTENGIFYVAVYAVKTSVPQYDYRGKYFALCTPSETETKTYDDNGTTTSMIIQKGNKILLSGKLPNQNTQMLYFIKKRSIYK